MYEFDDVKGIAGHSDPVGPMGRPTMCSNCGSMNITWNSATDVTTCSDCGWDNFPSVLRNLEKQIISGEYSETDVIKKLGCRPDEVTVYRGKKISRCPCCRSYFYADGPLA